MENSSDNTLTITKHKYTLDLLIRSNILETHPCKTPVVKGRRASILDGEYATDYKGIIGTWQYFTMAELTFFFCCQIC